jgi:hypothetical protein
LNIASLRHAFFIPHCPKGAKKCIIIIIIIIIASDAEGLCSSSSRSVQLLRHPQGTPAGDQEAPRHASAPHLLYDFFGPLAAPADVTQDALHKVKVHATCCVAAAIIINMITIREPQQQRKHHPALVTETTVHQA